MLFLFAIALFCFVGCNKSDSNLIVNKANKIHNVEVVFINRPHDYTIMVREKDQLVAKHIYGRDGGQVKVFTDAKNGIWVETRTWKHENGNKSHKFDADIHIHSKNDLQGGQWRERHGKGAEQVGGVNKIE